MDTIEPTTLDKRFGFSLQLYANRIEIEQGAFKNVAKKESILLRSITDVAVVGLTRKLQITTQDGRRHQFTVAKPDQTRTAILAAL